MKPKIYRLVPMTILTDGNYRSLPTEVGTTEPLYPYRDPRPMEHPQRASTASGSQILPMAPTHDANLDLECVHGWPFDLG